MNHKALCDALVEVSGTQILFHLIGLKTLAYKQVKHSLVCALTPEITGGGFHPPPFLLTILYKNSPTKRGLNSKQNTFLWRYVVFTILMTIHFFYKVGFYASMVSS